MKDPTPLPPTISFPLPIPKLTVRERLRRNVWWIAPIALLVLCAAVGGIGFLLGRSTASPAASFLGADERRVLTREDHQRELAAAVQRAEEGATLHLQESLAQHWRILKVEDGVAMTIRNNRWAAAGAKDFRTLPLNLYPVFCYVTPENDKRLGVGIAGNPRTDCFVFLWTGSGVPKNPRFINFTKGRTVVADE